MLIARAFSGDFELARNTEKKYEKFFFFQNILSKSFENVAIFIWLIHLQGIFSTLDYTYRTLAKMGKGVLYTIFKDHSTLLSLNLVSE